MSWQQVFLRISAFSWAALVFPFALPTQIYLIYPIYPLLLCAFMNVSCAQSAFSLQLKLPEQLDYKPDGRSQHFGED